MSRARRTETLNADFVDGYARAWAFGVHEAFRAPLDISLDTRMDREANAALAERLGRKPTAAERIVRTVWTQGNPPAYAFSRGQLMHEPAVVHTLPWEEALPLLQRSVLVLDAQPDAGAQPAAVEEALRAGEAATVDAATNGVTGTPAGATDAAGTGTTGAPATATNATATGSTDADEKEASTGAPHGSGWVEFALFHHENGQIVRREEHRLSQEAFVELLRLGHTDTLPTGTTESA